MGWACNGVLFALVCICGNHGYVAVLENTISFSFVAFTFL
jgi:hypothetical protein